jgi:hypothetical protein
MTIEKIKKMNSDSDADYAFVKSAKVNELIDKVNALSSEDGAITGDSLAVANGSVASPSITGEATNSGIFFSSGIAGFSTAGSHYAELTGAGKWIVYSSSTTGGLGTNVTNTLVPIYLCAAQQTIAAGNPGAINVTSHYTDIAVDADGDAFTLADGATVGQIKKIMLSATAGGTGVVTSKFTGAATTLTFTNAGEYAILQWDGTDWIALELGSVVTLTHKPVIA